MCSTRPGRTCGVSMSGHFLDQIAGLASEWVQEPEFDAWPRSSQAITMESIATILVLALLIAPGPPLELMGRLDAKVIPEASGIVKSRKHAGIFWVHNDSGNPPLLFAIRGDGRIVQTFRLEVPNIDWEDITIDDQGRLVLGDIGNNRGVLPVRALYRFDEPDPSKPAGEPLKIKDATFYAQPRRSRFDAEGLIIDHGVAILVAKYLDGREAELFSVALEPPAPLARPARPKLLGRLPKFAEPATGAALSTDQKLLAVCSPSVARVYRRGPRDADDWRLYAEVRYKPDQIEGICWDGSDLVLVAEGGGLYRLPEQTWRTAVRPGEPASRAGGVWRHRPATINAVAQSPAPTCLCARPRRRRLSECPARGATSSLLAAVEPSAMV